MSSWKERSKANTCKGWSKILYTFPSPPPDWIAEDKKEVRIDIYSADLATRTTTNNRLTPAHTIFKRRCKRYNRQKTDGYQRGLNSV